MAEEIVTPAATPAPEPQVSPEVEARPVDPLAGIELSDDVRAELKGFDFKNVREMYDTLKMFEKRHSDFKKEVSEQSRAEETEVEKTAKEIQLSTKRQETIQSLLPSFIENGMQLTDEMTAALAEVGLTETEIKLGAYEFRETLASHHEMMGGKETYDKVMAYHAQNLTKEEKAAFNNDINSGKHSKALMIGLKAMYEEAMASGTPAPEVPADRFRGNQVETGITGYPNRDELLRAKRYLDTPAGRRDEVSRARYKQRLAITDEKVWRGQ